jgi:tetratricopeptide (TPR) repeat protein
MNWGGWLAVLSLCAGIHLNSAAGQQQALSTNHVATLAEFAARAKNKFEAAKTQFQRETNNVETAWQFGRACYDWAEFATSSDQRADIAEQGIEACRQVVNLDPALPAGHYYLGMNLGQLARTKTLGALKLVGQMEREFKAALELDPKFDHAGPDRNLGLLYLQAPGWPASIGNHVKARTHLQKAVKLTPDYPENLLNLLEADLKWGDRNGATRDLKALEEAWPVARAKFADADWEASWVSWESRWEQLKRKAAEAPKVLQPPRKF